MSRGSDGEKLKLWRDRFRRYAKSALSVEEFCRGEGVSAPTFYQWRKKLAAARAGGSPASVVLFDP